MTKLILMTGSFLGALAVLLGAIGSHFFEDHLIYLDRLETYKTAVQYQFYHVFLILIIGLLSNYASRPIINYAFYSAIIGLFLFSGSLYMLCFTNNSAWGIVTPFGGLSLICSWLFLCFSVKKVNL